MFKKYVKIVLSILAVLGLVFLMFIPVFPFFERDLLGYYTLIVAIYTLLATILVSVVVYHTQRKDQEVEEKRRIDLAKSVILAEIEPSLSLMMKRERGAIYVGRSLGQLFMQYASELHNSLSQEQYNHLSTLVHYIDHVLRDEDDCGYDWDGIDLIAREWAAPIFKSEYGYLYDHIENKNLLFNEITVSLLIALGSKRNEYDKNIYSFRDKNGNEAIIFVPQEKEFIIYDDLEKIVEGTICYNDNLDRYALKDGFGKSKKYVGAYKNFKYHGDGCTFDAFGNKAQEGCFSEGELIKGTEYGCLYGDNGDEEDTFIARIGEMGLFDYNILKPYVQNYGPDKLYFIDQEVYGNAIEDIKNKTPFLEYLKENRPLYYKYFKDVEKDCE